MAVSSPPSKAFIWGANGAALTPEEIEKQKALEAAIVARGLDTSPVDHWTQGAGRVADALAGAFRRGRLDSVAKESSALGQSAFSDAIKAFGGGTSAAGQAAATSPYTTATTGSQTAYIGDLSGNDVYSGFMDTVKAGGVQNPYALAAIAATGKAESGFDPGNVNRTWSDPSQSGQPGRAGGIMSWRGPRMRRLQRLATFLPRDRSSSSSRKTRS
jgi:hypothetical protein